MISWVFPAFAFFVLIFLSGYFSASETALFSLSSLRVKAYGTSREPRKKLIAHLLHHPRDLLVTVFMLNTLVNILLQNVASSTFGEQAGWFLKVIFPLILTLIFGEIIPKYIGIQNNTSIAHLVAPPINFLQNLMKPIREVVVAVTAPISRILFFFLKREKSISKEELQHVLKQSQEHGVLLPDEAELVYGYLNLQDDTVKEVMWPREDILYYDIGDPLTKLVYLLVDKQCSRLPVCEGNIQNIIGIISAKQYFIYREEIQTPADLRRFTTKPYYVPETTTARALRRSLEEANQELAMVVDEYGFISGLVTYEDIVEVVIGNITDLRDREALYNQVGKNEIFASGKLELSEFNQIFGVELESPNNMVTVGGWLTERLGDIPKSGTKMELEGFFFNILAADPNRIRRVYIRKLPAKSPPTKKAA